MKFSDPAQARLALGYLLGVEELKSLYWRIIDHSLASLELHPFGLETVIAGLVDDDWHNQRIYLVAYPGHTDESVKAMLAVLCHALRGYHPQNPSTAFRLRVIRVQINKDWRDPSRYIHDLYFELITPMTVFICGGCNDCTGEGGDGGRRLEAVFSLVAAIHDIIVEEGIVPPEASERTQSELMRAYNQSRAGREAT